MPLPSQSSFRNLTAKVSNPAIFLIVSRASSLSDKHRASLPGSINKLCCRSSVPSGKMLRISGRSSRLLKFAWSGAACSLFTKLTGLERRMVCSGCGWTKATKRRKGRKMKKMTTTIGQALHSSSKSLILLIHTWHQEKALTKVFCLALILFLDCWMRGLHK